MKKLFMWFCVDQKLQRKLQDRYNEGYVLGYDKGKQTWKSLSTRTTALEARVERLDKLVFELRTRGTGPKNDST